MRDGSLLLEVGREEGRKGREGSWILEEEGRRRVPSEGAREEELASKAKRRQGKDWVVGGRRRRDKVSFGRKGKDRSEGRRCERSG